MTPERCPLCESARTAAFNRSAGRTFIRCADCALVFVSRSELPPPEVEKARYTLHRNNPRDSGYRRFLSPMKDALLSATAEGAVGLDFGCGPGPALAHMLHEEGRVITLYDPFFAPDEAVWSSTYDFIVAAEVFEHLHRPAFELDRLFAALRPGGVPGVITGFAHDTADEFAQWHYIRDPTHVCFFSRRTFASIATRWRAAARFPAHHIALLVRTGRGDACAAADGSRA